MISFTGPSLGARVRVLLITTTSVFLVFQIYNHVDYKILRFGEVHTPEHTGTTSTTLMPTAVDVSITATMSPSSEVHKGDPVPLGALIAAAMHTTDVSWMNELAEKYVAPLLHPYC
jgi:hypothetical protein